MAPKASTITPQIFHRLLFRLGDSFLRGCFWLSVIKFQSQCEPEPPFCEADFVQFLVSLYPAPKAQPAFSCFEIMVVGGRFFIFGTITPKWPEQREEEKSWCAWKF
jgi:hypothetical protein